MTTADSHTGDTNYTDISGAAIASGNFTAGRKYLIVITAQVGAVDGSNDVAIRTLHGSTPFVESQYDFETVEPNELTTYGWFTVWTAISSEAIKLQWKTIVGSNTVKGDNFTLFAMEISEELTEGADWHFDEVVTDTGLTTAWSTTNNATRTFTPSGSSDWLVLVRSRINHASANRQLETRIERAGEATSTTPFQSTEGEDTTLDRFCHILARPFACTAVSNTFTSASRNDGASSGTRISSAVFCLDLSRFIDVSTAHTTTTTGDIGDTSFGTEVQEVLITPTSTGNFWTLGQAVFNPEDPNGARSRVQIDNADQPPGATVDDDVSILHWDGTDQGVSFIQSVVSLSALSTIELDVSTDTGTSAVVEDRMLMSISLEISEADNDYDAQPVVSARMPTVHDASNLVSPVHVVASRPESKRVSG